MPSVRAPCAPPRQEPAHTRPSDPPRYPFAPSPAKVSAVDSPASNPHACLLAVPFIAVIGLGLAFCASGYGIGANHGRLELTAAQAWPTRGNEPAALSRAEWARACAIAGACAPPPDSGDASLAASVATLGCTGRPMMSEAAAIPMSPIGESPFAWQANERWAFFARALPAFGGDCAQVRARATARAAPIVCADTGCEWFGGTPPPLVRCQGDVATLLARDGPVQRDCAVAFATCGAASPTGCSDRAPVGCRAEDLSRCDGNVLLGCNDAASVTFVNCARHEGGTCRETATGAQCEYPNMSECVPSDQQCEGSTILLCIEGQSLRLDCSELGFTQCITTSAGPHCASGS